MGIPGIHDFALSEISKECGVVVICQCSRKYLVNVNDSTTRNPM
jgi:hypothetical protein